MAHGAGDLLAAADKYQLEQLKVGSAIIKAQLNSCLDKIQALVVKYLDHRESARKDFAIVSKLGIVCPTW